MDQLARVIMRDDSALTPGQRKMIAAYVSDLNKCEYCFIGHSQLAVNLGIERDLIGEIIDDIESSSVENNLKPILRFVKKLTLEPHTLTQADADAVFAEGWDEKALHDAILVACRFSFMNRLTLGHGFVPDPNEAEARAKRMGYTQPEPGLV